MSYKILTSKIIFMFFNHTFASAQTLQIAFSDVSKIDQDQVRSQRLKSDLGSSQWLVKNIVRITGKKKR